MTGRLTDARKTRTSRYLHNVLLINIIPGLRHGNLAIVDIINQIRGALKRIAKEKHRPVDTNDAEIAQRCAVAGGHGADVRGGSEWVDQRRLGNTDSRSQGTAESEVKGGVDSPLRTRNVRKSEVCGGV